MRTDGIAAEVLPDFIEAPTGRLSRGAHGHLYGSKPIGGEAGSGVLFRLTTGGTHEVLYDFKAAEGPPWASLFQPADGRLYGTTARTVFRIVLPG